MKTLLELSETELLKQMGSRSYSNNEFLKQNIQIQKRKLIKPKEIVETNQRVYQNKVINSIKYQPKSKKTTEIYQNFLSLFVPIIEENLAITLSDEVINSLAMTY